MADTKPIPFRTQCENDLLRAARKYGLMAMSGVYVDEQQPKGRGSICHVGFADRKDLEKLYGEDLLRAAKNLVTAMSIDEIDGRLQQ